MTDKDKVHGEGNYAASKQYNEATKKFVQSGKVDDAAKSAAPRSRDDAQQMERAEQAGKSRSKGEDPELYEGDDDDEAVDDDSEDEDARP
jgi:hypothetical protein